ncbi:hypothetical protein HAT86_06940 [Roseovarius gahaiensis]|uniref:Uncharacterized protein n=1 Tax=Roseovarius gahaiensis TaxID=2716691 RepID=A0A967BCV1_9RHOB|nr:hypothetical protein [Roseovarius gahaiensis]NHQ74200.1 hypothetical protein [Roseovarius gahaiensis]
MFEVGSACEALWREEQKQAIDAKKDQLFNKASELRHLWQRPRLLPLSERKQRRQSEDAQNHTDDIEEELAFLKGNHNSDGPISRLVTLSAKPPRGTEKKIKNQIANVSGFKPKQVEYLWRAFRKQGFD